MKRLMMAADQLPSPFQTPCHAMAGEGGGQSWLTVFPTPGLGIELLSGPGFCCRAWSWLVLFSGPWRIPAAPGWVWVMHSLPAPAIQRPSASQLPTHEGRSSVPCCRVASDATRPLYVIPGSTQGPILLPGLGRTLPFCNHRPQC